MVSALVVGINTYKTRAQATSYLADSVRAGAWAFLGPDDQDRAMITAFRTLENLGWQGTSTDVDEAVSAVVAVGGTGYAVDDVLTAVGGTFGVAATFKVTGESAGVVTTITPLNVGTYSDVPTNPVSTTGGGGTGCTLTLTILAQLSRHPRIGLTDCDGNDIDELLVAQGVCDGQIELAYELTQDSDVETSPGTESNLKRAKAGSAEVELFRPDAGAVLPQIVFDLVKCFLASTTSAVAPVVGDSTSVSQFTDCERSDLTEGYK